jgi:GNAT superfamily N-acetyltransferase
MEKASLIEAVEAGFSALPRISGLMEHVEFSGICGHETAFSHPMVNMVTSTDLTEENADGTIELVLDYFSRKQKAFGWMVGPSAAPADLGKRLRKAGLAKLFDAAGMALTDFNLRSRMNPDVRISEAGLEEVAVACEALSEFQAAPAEVVRLLYEVLTRDPRLKARFYLAYMKGEKDPVAISAMGLVPGMPVAYLRGVTTNKAFRGRGIYRSLLARRISDARKDGTEAAVIQAILTTTAPICRKLGFFEICRMEFYTWSPRERPVPRTRRKSTVTVPR